MNRYLAHLKVITKHKFVVMGLCFKCKRIKRGLLHDLSKYSFGEFFTSARYFQGNKSPIDAEKIDKGYSYAWQHHKGHNPHHWEYWIDNVGTYKNDPIKIPYEYVVEMMCDWVGAGIVYSNQKCDFDLPYSEPLDYYNKYRAERIFHPETEKLLLYFLNIIKDEGINSFCRASVSKTNPLIIEYMK